MTARGRYALLSAGVIVATAAVGLRLVSEADRAAVWWGLLAAVVVQGPLGWWVVSAIGTERFVGAWALGLLARLLLLGLMALVVGPLLGLDATALLLTTAGVLGALLLVEGAVALMELPRMTGR